MIIVSACLAGINCALDGKSRPCEKVIELVRVGKAIPLCPEQLGGLTTPRPAAEKKGDRVYRKDGRDVTENFQRGAEEILRIAKLVGCKKAILKARSPSCGSGKIHDGTFSGNLIEGDGICAKLLKDNNITVYTDEEI